MYRLNSCECGPKIEHRLPLALLHCALYHNHLSGVRVHQLVVLPHSRVRRVQYESGLWLLASLHMPKPYTVWAAVALRER